MVKKSWKSWALALVITATIAMTGAAEAQKGDAARSADATARASVQTIYHNLLNAGYEWPYIRDEKMPEILIRSVDAIEKSAGSYEPRLIVGTFIPTYINSFYDEIDKLNEEHQARCLEVGFLSATFVPFVQACSHGFGGKFTPDEILGGILQVHVTVKVCGNVSICSKRLADDYRTAFQKELKAEKDFSSVCGSGS